MKNIIPLFLLGTLSFYSAGHFGDFLDKLETTGFGKQNPRSSYMQLALIALSLRSASAIVSLAVEPVAVACRPEGVPRPGHLQADKMQIATARLVQ